MLCSITEQSMPIYILTVYTLLNKCSYRDNCTNEITGSHLGYDGPGFCMYKFLCKSPVPRKVQLSTQVKISLGLARGCSYSELIGALNPYLQ